MPVIQVVSAGLQTTVQDLGRHGFGALGVSPAGAADPTSLRIGNRLAGNAARAAALEMTLMGGAYLFPDGAVVAIAGSDFGATLDGAAVEMWSPFEIRPRQTLRLPHTKTGARCYLCIHGGLVTPLFLGSASTHLLSGLGGVEGRALVKGDQLEIGVSSEPLSNRAASVVAIGRVVPGRALVAGNSDNLLRVTRGRQAARYGAEGFDRLLGNRYRVTEDANRMGLRLDGPVLEDLTKSDMITEGVGWGAIQVPPGGQPIILNVEQQTAGGYPKIANVISADLALLGQLRPRDEIRFAEVSIAEAVDRLGEQERYLASEEWIDE